MSLIASKAIGRFDMDCREEFEKWWFGTDLSTGYHSQPAWESWQACWHLRQESKPIGVDEKTFDTIAEEIKLEAFDEWEFNKTSKQYMGAFYIDDCKRVLKRHLSALPSQPEPIIINAVKDAQYYDDQIEQLKFSNGAMEKYGDQLKETIKQLRGQLRSADEDEELTEDKHLLAISVLESVNKSKINELQSDLTRKNEQIKRLKGYAIHRISCAELFYKDCDCKLDELLAEIGED